MGIKFFDYDNDGRPDLIITDMHSDMSEQVGVGPGEEEVGHAVVGRRSSRGAPTTSSATRSSTTWASGKFEEVSDAMGVENYWPWGLSAGDLNADGFQDIFITASMNFPFRYGINSLLLNDRGKIFRDSEFILGVEPRRDGRTHVTMVRTSTATATTQANRSARARQDGHGQGDERPAARARRRSSISTTTATSTSSPTTSTPSR